MVWGEIDILNKLSNQFADLLLDEPSLYSFIIFTEY